MGRLRAAVVLGGAVACVGALVYHFGLSEAARENLRSAGRSVRDAYEEVERIVNRGSEEVADPEQMPNRVSTRAQWESLGY